MFPRNTAVFSALQPPLKDTQIGMAPILHVIGMHHNIVVLANDHRLHTEEFPPLLPQPIQFGQGGVGGKLGVHFLGGNHRLTFNVYLAHFGFDKGGEVFPLFEWVTHVVLLEINWPWL